MRNSSRVAWIIALAVGASLYSHSRTTHADPPQEANQAKSNDDDAWARKLAELKDDDWRGAFQLGGNLASLPPDEGFRILQQNWAKIKRLDHRQQMLKAWRSAPFPFHPRLLDLLDLGMHDEAPEVRGWASQYLADIALQDFSEDVEAYKTWYATSRGQPMDQIVVAAVRRFVEDLDRRDTHVLKKRGQLSIGNQLRNIFQKVPQARQAALDAGILKIMENWINKGTALGANADAIQLAARGLEVIAELNVDEENLKRLVVSLVALKKDSELRRAAVQVLERKDPPWAVDLLIQELTQSLYSGNDSLRVDWNTAGVLAKIGDPRAIPAMIGLIDADNSYDTVYGVGYFGLAPMTKVAYSSFHDGAWWAANRQKYPESVQALTIPELKKTAHGRRHVPFPEDIDTLQGKLNLAREALASLDVVRTGPIGPRMNMMNFAREVAEHNDPHAIPTLIGIIDADNSYDTVYGAGYFGLSNLTKVEFSPFHDGAWWRRWWEANRSQFDDAVQAIPIPVFEKTANGKQHIPFPDDLDTLQGLIRFAAEFHGGQSSRNKKRAARVSLSDLAQEMVKHKDPHAIPYLIGLIPAKAASPQNETGLVALWNSLTGVAAEDIVYHIGYYGLERLTKVKFDRAHDGAWWREWWQEYKAGYPQDVRDIEIPDFKGPLAFAWKEPPAEKMQLAEAEKKQVQEREDLADVADVPTQDLTVGGNKMMRYFLIGAAADAGAPDEPYGLLVVLPGGDGSADFHPFMRRVYKNVLGKRWLMAQAVAPRWDAGQAIVWPTEKLSPTGAQFTTEAFIEAIIADVRGKTKIDPRRIFLLGWSSGGPACYAAIMRKETPVTGAFIAMSVFKPDQMATLENAKDKPIYLLQSPDDRVTPMRFAEQAEKSLGAAGAKVRLKEYDGGHGWRGDVWNMIGDGIQWLEKPETPTEKSLVVRPSKMMDPGLEDPDVGKKEAAWFLPGVFRREELGYRVESDTAAVFAGERCARLERVDPKAKSAFGNIMQVIDATPYRGKRIRYRAAVRAEVDSLESTAQLWLRVDRVDQDKNEAMGFFDNMHDRPIRSKEWKHYEIVGDVAEDAVSICLGMILVGDGKAWLDDATVEVVGADVTAKTDKPAAKKAKDPGKNDPNILLDPSAEEGDVAPAEWLLGAKIDGVEYSWDKSIAKTGKASLCLSKTANRYFPIAEWYQIVERKTGSPSLQVSAQVKAERVSKAILDVVFLDENGEAISHQWAASIGTKDAPADHNWKEYLGKVEIPEKAKRLQIGLQIYGPGKVWFDDIRAEYTE
jgi:predicted esterase